MADVIFVALMAPILAVGMYVAGYAAALRDLKNDHLPWWVRYTR
jgi:hypothetical protein